MNAEKINAYLSMIANQNTLVNLGMHLLVAAAVLSLLLVSGDRLRGRIIDGVICLLLFSVAANALVYGNPFHLIVFSLLALLSIVDLAAGKNRYRFELKKPGNIVALIFIGLGFWYPEFTRVTPLQQIFLSPLGIVPCPTLLVVFGLLKLADAQVRSHLSRRLVFPLLVFGLVGVWFLGVYLDVALIFAAASLLYRAVIAKTGAWHRSVSSTVRPA